MYQEIDEELFQKDVVTTVRHWLSSQGIDPDALITCEVCGQPVTAWEAVYVNVAYYSVPSHLVCPKDGVFKIGYDSGLNKDFDFEAFLKEIYDSCNGSFSQLVTGELIL